MKKAAAWVIILVGCLLVGYGLLVSFPQNGLGVTPPGSAGGDKAPPTDKVEPTQLPREMTLQGLRKPTDNSAILPVTQPSATLEDNPCRVEKKPGSYVGGLVPTPARSPVSIKPEKPDEKEPAAPQRPYWRSGIGVSAAVPVDQLATRLGAGWYLDFQVHEMPASGGVEHWQMVRTSSKGTLPSLGCIQYIARRYPGQTWIIGNEPDVIWQDNTPPEIYARLYGELYAGIKAVDPQAKVAVGGVAAVTPLRLEYLDQVLLAYQKEFGKALPADWWTVHAYVLREERGSWGIEIPPGMRADKGKLYEVKDHARLDLFEGQLKEFRAWMASRGYRDKPLALTEFGILMPSEYGFPPEQVAAYLKGSFALLESLKRGDTGLAADDNRLVQRWAWFSLADNLYLTANLVDLDDHQLTLNGRAFQEFVKTRQK